MMGYKPEDRWYYHAGKKAHDIIQRHVSGVEDHPYLKHIKETFPIVETMDFDPACKFEINFNEVLDVYQGKMAKQQHSLNEQYRVIGFFDGRDNQYKKFLEIKSSSNPWSLIKFKTSLQRKLYTLSNVDIEECYLITGQKEPEKWEKEPPKIFKVPATEADRIEAIKFVLDGIETIRKGDFTGGLDENGKCTDPWCYFGKNCQFK
jgi:hypothetical protein